MGSLSQQFVDVDGATLEILRTDGGISVRLASTAVGSLSFQPLQFHPEATVLLE